MSLREILEKLLRRELSIEEAVSLIKLTGLREVEELAKLDVGRDFRRSIPEIVYCEGKSVSDLEKIIDALLEERGRAILSRVSKSQLKLLDKYRENYVVEFSERARMAVIKEKSFKVEKSGKVGVITAGTIDIPVAEQVRIVAEEMGCEVYTCYDVGVAGIHRVFPALKEMIERDVDVLVVVAGMEGTLPSIIAGLVDIPVIGVPTSHGYGFGGRGKAALTTMLQSCSLGVTVVNIDNGVGAGVAASLIAKRASRGRGK